MLVMSRIEVCLLTSHKDGFTKLTAWQGKAREGQVASFDIHARDHVDLLRTRSMQLPLSPAAFRQDFLLKQATVHLPMRTGKFPSENSCCNVRCVRLGDDKVTSHVRNCRIYVAFRLFQLSVDAVLSRTYLFTILTKAKYLIINFI